MTGKKILLVDEWGSRLRLRRGMLTLFIRQEGKIVKKLEVSPVELDSIIFWVRGSSISIAAILEALKYGVDIVIFDNGKPAARVVPSKYGSIYRIWTRQLLTYLRKDKRLKIAKMFVYGKIENQMSNLRYFSKLFIHNKKMYYEIRRHIDNMYKILQKLYECNSVDEVRNVEASAARHYWKVIKLVVPQNLGFKKRLKKYDIVPGVNVDPVNKALNIAYGILKKEVWRSIFLVGLNPYIGFLHKPRPSKLSLVFDLMEEFRPFIDRLIVMACRKTPSKIKILSDPDKEGEGVVNVVKLVYEGFSKSNIQACINTQARRLLNYILREEPYTPFKLV